MTTAPIRQRRTWLTPRAITTFAAIGLALLAGSTPASAVTTTAWADFTPLTGTANAFETQLTFGTAPGLTAAVTSTSRAGQVGVISGASTWLSEGTAIGAKYGSSRNEPCLNLRPRADSAASPSVTTYTFDTPTPSAGWAFALGDIDADSVRITAVTASGTPATAAQLGYRQSFNYCAAGIVGKPSCTGDALDVPTWNPATTTLVGNDQASDTSGAAAWFEPNTPLESLTFTFSQRSGFPVYQTWFTSLGRDIAGNVSASDGSAVAGVALTLVDESGTVVGNTSTIADGSYTFSGYTAADGYTVTLARPVDRVVVGPSTLPADIAVADALDVNFVVRDMVPVPVSGSVLDADGQPIAGVAVTLTGDNNGSQTATTDATGSYRFDAVEPDNYTVAIGDVAGFVVETSPAPFAVPEDSETPITAVNFVLTPLPSFTGIVTIAGESAAGVTLTATGPGGTTTAITAADGSYLFPGLSDGDYTITATTPGGTTPIGSPSRTETVDGDDLSGINFEFARSGSAGGIVTDTDGNPMVGTTVTVTGPGGPVVVTTNSDGAYGFAGLAPGSYEITLTLPDAFESRSDLSLSITITAIGESILDQNFLVEALATEVDPTPTSPANPSPGFTPIPGSGNGLPTTGVQVIPIVTVGTLALLLGGLALALPRRRRIQRSW